jgi:hypothetical protein
MKLPLSRGTSKSTSHLKGSTKVLSSINEKSVKRHSSAVQNYHLAGIREVGPILCKRSISSLPKSKACVMTRDANGQYKFKENDKRAWGFLVKNKAKPFLLIRHVEDRKANEAAGYSIGGGPESAIR